MRLGGETTIRDGFYSVEKTGAYVGKFLEAGVRTNKFNPHSTSSQESNAHHSGQKVSVLATQLQPYPPYYIILHLLKLFLFCLCLQIACGFDHTLLLTIDGQVLSCGWGADGQTGKAVAQGGLVNLLIDWLTC